MGRNSVPALSFAYKQIPGPPNGGPGICYYYITSRNKRETEREVSNIITTLLFMI